MLIGGVALCEGCFLCPTTRPPTWTPKTIESGVLFRYKHLGRIYHCPADKSTVIDRVVSLPPDFETAVIT
jgi:hypothetical protein